MSPEVCIDDNSGQGSKIWETNLCESHNEDAGHRLFQGIVVFVLINTLAHMRYTYMIAV